MVALAETVRQTSKSRTSTYKLHIRPSEESRHLPLPVAKFEEVVRKNIKLYRRTRQRLVRSKFLRGRRYVGKIRVGMHDARRRFSGQFDLVVTSPPYGDNQSTVPYGQSSFLPLQWIAMKDIDPRISKSWIRTAYEIDNRSLGGNVGRASQEKRMRRFYRPRPALLARVRTIPKEPLAGRRKILRFALDIDASLKGDCRFRQIERLPRVYAREPPGGEQEYPAGRNCCRAVSAIRREASPVDWTEDSQQANGHAQ